MGDVFKQALDDNGLKYRGWENGYISTIQSPEGYWLGEFTNGKYSGWMYTVNGSHPSLGLNEYKFCLLYTSTPTVTSTPLPVQSATEQNTLKVENGKLTGTLTVKLNSNLTEEKKVSCLLYTS